MFRAHLKLNEASDLDDEILQLRHKAARADLPKSSIDELTSNFAVAVQPLIESGRLMRSQGSALNVSRTFNGADYKVKLDFSTGNSESFVTQIKRFLFGR